MPHQSTDATDIGPAIATHIGPTNASIGILPIEGVASTDGGVAASKASCFLLGTTAKTASRKLQYTFQPDDVGTDVCSVGVCGYVYIYYVYKRSLYIRYTDVKSIGRSENDGRSGIS